MMRGRPFVVGFAALATASALVHAAVVYPALSPGRFTFSLVMMVLCGLSATLLSLRLAREREALQAELAAERERRTQIERHSCEMYRELEVKLEQRTERLLRERDIVARTEKLNALGRLAGGMAHELNNPLTAILGEATMLRRRCEVPELSRGLRVIEQQAARCADLVRDLGAFAGIEQRKVRPLDVHALLEGALAQALPATSREVSVVRQYWHSGPLIVAGNMEQLQQALVNVIGNACQAMAKAERAQLTLRTQRTENGRVCVEVSDTGAGIDPAILPYIFDPFFSRLPAHSCIPVGLGLSVALGLIQTHEGSISAESEVGRGTTVRIDLPEAMEPPEVLSLQAS